MYSYKNFIFLIILCTSFNSILSQESKFHTNTSISTSGFVSNDSNPFWFTANTNGAIADKTNVLLSGSTYFKYSLNKKSAFSAGLSFFLRDGVNRNLQRNDLYLQYENPWLRFVLGSKAVNLKREGLSSVNDNFSLSGNARAIPGILVESPKPIKIFNRFYIEYALGNFYLNDTRYVDNAKLHYKSFAVQWKLNGKNDLTVGVEHYAQYGGTSPEFGEQPDSLKDYVDVFFASGASEEATDNDILNALGNHLGIYKLNYNYRSKKHAYNFYHHHPFEDGSGTGLVNIPDGIWGLYFQPNFKDIGFLRAVVLEYIQTTSQSDAFGVISGRDNYFNNGIYRSGWTYDNNTIGIALLKPDPNGNGIINNRVKALHLGTLLKFGKIEIRTKITFSQNDGTYSKPYIERENAIFTFIKGQYTTQKLGSFAIQFGSDYSNIDVDRFGLGTTYTYSF